MKGLERIMNEVDPNNDATVTPEEVEDAAIDATDAMDEDSDAPAATDASLEEETESGAIAVPTDVSSPEKPAAAAVVSEPTQQLKRLGGDFLANAKDIRLYKILTMQQVGEPHVAIRPVEKEVEREEKDKDGNVVKKKVKVTENIKDITHTWGPAQAYGDPHGSITSALRAQADYAKTFRKDGYDVKEFISKEYGVWYVTDPAGARPGMRFSIQLGDRKPAPPPKEKKPTKTQEEKDAEKAARAAERAAAKAAKDAAKPPKETKSSNKAVSAAPVAVAEPAVSADDVDVAE